MSGSCKKSVECQFSQICRSREGVLMYSLGDGTISRGNCYMPQFPLFCYVSINCFPSSSK